MDEQSSVTTQPAPVSEPERQPYTPPALWVHGTIKSLTQAGDIGGGDASGVPDGF